MKNIAKWFNILLVILFITLTSYKGTTVTSIKDKFIVGGWVKLGKQAASEGAYKDELELGEEKTNIKRLKIKALKNSIYITSVLIIYDDATSESHRVSGRIEKGSSSRAFNLIGHHRTIKKIVFNYRGANAYKGTQLIVLGKS